MLNYIQRVFLNFIILTVFYSIYTYTNIFISFLALLLYIVHAHVSYVNAIEISNTIDTKDYDHNIDLENIVVVRTNQSFGEAVCRIKDKNVIKIPGLCSNSKDFLTVLHHEYYHISENHKYKYDLIKFLLLSISLLVSTFFMIYISLSLIVISSLLVVFILNIYRHRIEYMADDFAKNHVSKEHVINRVKEYPNKNRYRDFRRYIYPYPPLRERLQRLTD